MTVKAKRGRPPFVPTDEQRETVRILKAGGMSNEEIAAVIGIHRETLAHAFSDELTDGAAKVRAEVLTARYRAAIGGNVAAQNKLLEMAGTVPLRRRAPKKEPALGKKEAANLEAQTAHEGSDWSDLVH